MSSVLEAGFVFWGVFVVFFLVIVAYVAWMLMTEADEDRGERP